MSYAYTSYSETSGSTSVEANGAGGYNTWGKVTASCSTSGSTLYYTLTVNTSNYPYMRVVFWVSGIGNVYDSGYVKTNSSAFPRGNGTTYSSSVNLGSSSSNPTVAVGIGVSTNSVTWGANKTMYRTATDYAYWDINAYNPAGVQDYKAAYFDEYIGNTKIATQVTNENANYIYQPYGTWGYVGNIQPYYNYYELDYVADNGGVLSPNANGLYGSYLNGNEDDILIYMKYKSSTLTFNLNEGSWKPNSGITSNTRAMTYNSKTSTAPIPIRTGYKFLGWYTATSGGTKIFNADGSYSSGASDYWFSDGRYKGYTDLNIYAQWEIQNVCYVKQDNTWKLSTVYIKTSTGWQPAIMYIKTDGGWVQSGP